MARVRKDFPDLDLKPKIVETNHDSTLWEGYIILLEVKDRLLRALTFYDATIEWIDEDLQAPNDWPRRTIGAKKEHPFVIASTGSRGDVYQVRFRYSPSLAHSTVIVAKVDGIPSDPFTIRPIRADVNIKKRKTARKKP